MPRKSARLRLSGHRSGAIAIHAALCLVIAVGFLAFSIDLGYLATAESDLQNAADSAALSAANALPDRTAAVSAARQWAGKHSCGGRPVAMWSQEDIEIGTWDKETATFTRLADNSPLTPDAVRITCRRSAQRGNSLPLFFAPIFGTKTANLTVEAIAQKAGSSCNGIMALEKIYLNDRQVGRASYTDSYNSSKGDYFTQTPKQNGDICTNGHLTLNGNSYVNGDARWWEEAKTPKAVPAQVSGELKSFKEPIEFPEVDPGNSPTINDNGKIPLSNQGKNPLSNGVFALSGANDSVVLSPGTYYFKSLTVSGNSKVFVTGRTYIYVQGNVDLRFGAMINQTRRPINLQMYLLGEDTYFYLPFFGELHASIYSTKAHIYLDEKSQPVNLHFFGKMVGQKIRVWDTALHVDESLTFGSLKSGGEQKGKSGSSLVQ